ncbi:hypothetical protein BJY52DRAFT_1224818 [Lactarius psammicola]|nr:hypothetical protein BJY52DRAFT_1224818 [Lactarius psammicola]
MPLVTQEGFASFGVIKARIYLSARNTCLTFWGRVPYAAYIDEAQPTEAKTTTTLPPLPIGGRNWASSLTVPPLTSSSSMCLKRRTSDALPSFATVIAHSTSSTISTPPHAAEASLRNAALAGGRSTE